VGAVNQSGSDMYSNIYLLSLNQGAGTQAQDIVKQFLAGGWRFNLGLTASEQAMIRRDLARLNDLATLRKLLQTYADANNDQYPQLTSGSFIASQTTSVWPSWQANLGNELGSALPTDPLNRFTPDQCKSSDGYDPATCWNETANQFTCPDGSHIYQYESIRDGESYRLKANFEYKSVIWQGNTLLAVPATDTCGSVNYQPSPSR